MCAFILLENAHPGSLWLTVDEGALCMTGARATTATSTRARQEHRSSTEQTESQTGTDRGPATFPVRKTLYRRTHTVLKVGKPPLPFNICFF